MQNVFNEIMKRVQTSKGGMKEAVKTVRGGKKQRKENEGKL